jgi:hypothetical protein
MNLRNGLSNSVRRLPATNSWQFGPLTVLRKGSHQPMRSKRAKLSLRGRFSPEDD